jgi:DNA-binding beta-propeller fold protein YncE
MRKRKLLLDLLLLAFIFSGCASEKPKEERLIWPLAPEQPRIAYVTQYRGESSLQERSAFTTFLLGKPADAIDFGKPYGVTTYQDKIYVTDTQRGVVFILDTINRKVSFVGNEGAALLSLPTGIAVDRDGTIYVADAKQKRILVYGNEGQILMVLGEKDDLKNPGGLAINRDLQRLYLVDSRSHMVYVYSAKEKKLLFQFGQHGTGDGEFHFPTNVAVDPRNGKVYVVDTMNFRVQVFDQDGKFITKFGRIGRQPGTFSRPKGIGIDSEGHVYVVDANFGNFQIFDENGILLLFIGSPGAGRGQFFLPAGLYVDERDRIYMVDSLNRRVQVLQYLSEKWQKENPEEYQKICRREK